jgi:hypothetical protein
MYPVNRLTTSASGAYTRCGQQRGMALTLFLCAEYDLPPSIKERASETHQPTMSTGYEGLWPA